MRNPEKYKAQLERRKVSYHANPSKHRAYLLVREYGITLDQYFAMMAEQDGKCKLCREPFGKSRGKRPALDHDHETHKVRGILHGNCNIALGMLQDSPELCGLAAECLRSHQAEAKGNLLQMA